ncbi:MAG: hypothetical protein RMM31_06305, partial [Anaerolineae bacterium]|nr:hypothetical protein [Anaerolineae bacterium]
MEDENVNGTVAWPLRWQVDIAPQVPPEPALEAVPAVRAALRQPLALLPLNQLHPLPQQVVLACDALPLDPHRAAVVQVLLEDLEQAGLPPQRVVLLVASLDAAPTARSSPVAIAQPTLISSLTTVCH